MIEVINLTPHDIVVRDPKGSEKIYPASGVVARLEMESSKVGSLDGFPVIKNHVVGHNLPDPQEGVYLLVSAPVLAQLGSTRADLIAPNTNEAIRNEKGHIVAVPGFVK